MGRKVEHKEDCYLQPLSPEIPKCLGQYNQIRTKLKLSFRFNKSALEDNKFKEPGEIIPSKPVSCSNRTVSKLFTQNADAENQTVALIST